MSTCRDPAAKAPLSLLKVTLTILDPEASDVKYPSAKIKSTQQQRGQDQGMLLRGAAISLKRKSKESSWVETQSGAGTWVQTGNLDRQLLKAQEIQSASPGGAGYKPRMEEKID